MQQQRWWQLVGFFYRDWKDQQPDRQDQKAIGEFSCNRCVCIEKTCKGNSSQPPWSYYPHNNIGRVFALIS